MKHVDEYESMDRAALESALLRLKVCPKCRRELLPVAFCKDTYGCADCKETFYLPKESR